MASTTSWRAGGDRREEIFRDDRDRWKFLGYLAEGAERYRVKVHCYVLMENHLHLVATTPEGNLSKWIDQLKTAFTVYFNGIKESSGPRTTDRRKTGQLSEPSRSLAGE